MDPFTVALAVFGVQKLRGKSTSRSFRDALLAATGTQFAAANNIGAEMGIKGFTLGEEGSLLSKLGPSATSPTSLAYDATLSTAEAPKQIFAPMLDKTGLEQIKGQYSPLSFSQQFQTTPIGKGISALAGDPYKLENIDGRTVMLPVESVPQSTLFGTPEVINKEGTIIQKGTGYRGLGTAEKLGLGLGTSTFFGKLFDKKPVDTTKGFTEEQYKEAYARQPNLQLKPTTRQEYLPSSYAYDYTGPLYGFNKGGIVNALPRYAAGGINYLPSKIDHDENDVNNYVRASGYVEDGTGSGDKDEDTILAQLADGEFVSRTDAVLGAGILAGASPSNMKDMRQKGAAYFYEQQARFKRIFDLLDASRKVN